MKVRLLDKNLIKRMKKNIVSLPKRIATVLILIDKAELYKEPPKQEVKATPPPKKSPPKKKVAVSSSTYKTTQAKAAIKTVMTAEKSDD